jgi:hypothetical protein
MLPLKGQNQTTIEKPTIQKQTRARVMAQVLAKRSQI